MAEIEQTPKKGARKPDPMGRIINDLKAQIKALGEVSTLDIPTIRARGYGSRAAAWGRQYRKEGTLDGLILSLAFESLASLNKAERQYSLTQLAAAALIAAERAGDAE